MKILRFFTALFFLLIPFIGRYFWFNKNTAHVPRQIEIPNYEELQIQEPVIHPAETVQSEVELSIPPVVLLDFSHENYFSLAELDDFRQLLEDLGAKVMVNTDPSLLSTQLKSADSFVSISPTYLYYPEEVRLVEKFVQRGGHLLVISDPTREYNDPYYLDTTSYLTSTDIANLLLSSYHVSFRNDYVYNIEANEGNFRNVFFDVNGDTPYTADLNRVVFYGSHSLQTDQLVILQGDSHTYSSLTDLGGALTVMAEADNGHVLVIGDVSFLTAPFNRVYDNWKLIENIARFLIHSDRTPNFLDFPFIFDQDVMLIVPNDLEFNKDMLDMFRALQRLVTSQDLTLAVGTEPLEGFDLIIFATFPVNEKLNPFIEPFELTFTYVETQTATGDMGFIEPTPGLAQEPTPTPVPGSEASGLGITLDEYPAEAETPVSTVTIPDFGTVKMKDVGIVLFDSQPQSKRLILIAEKISGVKELVNILTIGYLQDCILLSDKAICNLPESFDQYSSGYSY